MRRLLAILLALLATAPVGAVLSAGTALAADTGPALVPGALDGSVPVRAGEIDASDRWIVVMRAGTGLSPASSLAIAGARASALGIRQDRVFNASIRGYAARLTNAQLALLRADARVEEVVPDDIVSLTGETVPTGVRRVNGLHSPIAQIDGNDTRVNADVAIVDTGIDPHHVDLNVAGGYSCSTSSPTAYFDPNGHGTHVAGTVGALDNGYGVVGVAPGVRLWAVRILDSVGNGLLSWYVCGLDWIAAQKDPTDPTRPLIEAVNMSVQKSGHDDHNCGYTNGDVMHRAVCRVVNAGITVVAAAGNNRQNVANWIPAAYSEVITVSALADTDGKPGGRGGNACNSWGGYDKDDTFADFSNYGAGVDIIAPGKCILSTLPGNQYGVKSGTSMATPLVTGAAALYKSSRPNATPAQVKAALIAMGSHDWNTSTDPDKWHEPLLDVSWIVDAGDFAIRSIQTATSVSAAGGTVVVPMDVVRGEELTVPVDVTVTPTAPLTATLSASQYDPGAPSALTVTITLPPGTPNGTYPVTVTASDGTRERTAVYRVLADSAVPVAAPAVIGATVHTILGIRTFAGSGRWPAGSDAFGGVTSYQAQWRVDGGAWGLVIGRTASNRVASRTFAVGHTYQLRVRALDAAGNASPWVASPATGSYLVQETSSRISRGGIWHRRSAPYASGGSVLYATHSGAWYGLTFSGRGIAIIAPLAPGRTTFDVYLDGVKVARVSELASSYRARRILYAVTGLPAGSHKFRVVAEVTPGHQRMDLDALLVLR